jgi:hypothetical protein
MRKGDTFTKINSTGNTENMLFTRRLVIKRTEGFVLATRNRVGGSDSDEK